MFPCRPTHRSSGVFSRACRFVLFGSGIVLCNGCSTRAGTASLVPTPPTLVTVVPFQLYYGFVLVPAEIDGHRGTFLLDTGAPFIALNSQYLHAGPQGIDTVPAVPAVTPPREGVNVTVHTLRVGTLLEHLDSTDVGPPEPVNPTNATIMTDSRMQQFGRPVLGWLGLPALAPFQTIIDYVHQRLVLIRLDAAGHPLAAVPAYTPATTLSLVPVMDWGEGKGRWWGVRVQGILANDSDTLSENTEWLLDTGAPCNQFSIRTRKIRAAHLRPASEEAIQEERRISRKMLKAAGEKDDPSPDTLQILDHLDMAGHSFDVLPFQPGLLYDILGYPFLSQFGAVGFNLRTRALLFYTVH